jgi:hypothetical protein
MDRARAGRHRKITRRAALRRVAAGAAGVAGVSRGGLAAKPGAGGGGAIRLERQATGSEVWQVTTDRLYHSNIYCEVPYCSKDSRYFVYVRKDPKLAGNRWEFMVVELGTWKQHRLDVSIGIPGCAMRPDGVFYYLKRTRRGVLDLMRADLADGKGEKVYQLKDGPWRSLGTVSADGRYYVRSKTLDDKYSVFGVVLFDLAKGTETVIDRDPYTLNAHPQIEPGAGKRVMIQHNRGGKCKPDGGLERLVGPQGATLYLLSLPEGKRTELQVGKPFTTPVTGHEAWIGSTGEVLLSVAPSGEYAPEKGNLLGVRAGRAARVVARGFRFNHVGVSRCGRLFCCDDWRGTCKLVIGSTRTGKSAVVCESKTSMGRPQNTHAHAYLTPDLKWVVFQSDRSGFPQIHAARVPDGMVEKLL